LIFLQIPAKSTKTTNTSLPVQTNANITHRRLCSNSQELKRRQLAHGARNRARQLIVAQVSAKIDENDKHIPSVQTNAKTITERPLCSNSQLIKRRQLAHGARNRAAQLIDVQVSAKSTWLGSDQRKHIPHRRLCSNSQELKRRQLAHGARNRATQLIVAQEPAN
jgi:hypothetical protein